MKSKIILPAFLLACLGGSAVYGLNCPSLSNLNIKLSNLVQNQVVMGRWTVVHIKSLQNNPKLLAHDAWIVTNGGGKDAPGFETNSLLCNYKLGEDNTASRLGLAIRIDPRKYTFNGVTPKKGQKLPCRGGGCTVKYDSNSSKVQCELNVGQPNFPIGCNATALR